MEIYKLLEDVNGHIVFEKGDSTILVMTGSTHSFHCGNEPVSICYTNCLTDEEGGIESMSRRLNVMLEKDESLAPVRTMLCGFSLDKILNLFRSRHGESLAKALGINIGALDAVNGKDVKMTAKALGIDFDQISRHVGVPVTTILGNDNLSKFKVVIDKIRGQIMFDAEDIPFEGTAADSFVENNLFKVNVKINGIPHQAIFDTGIAASYAPRTWLDGCIDKGKRIDFHPLADYYTVPVFRALTEFAGDTFPVRYGVMPENLQSKVTEINEVSPESVQGILGADVIRNGRTYLDVSRGILKVEK